MIRRPALWLLSFPVIIMAILIGVFYLGPAVMRETAPGSKIMSLGLAAGIMALVFIPLAVVLSGAEKHLASFRGDPDQRFISAPVGLATITGLDRTGLSVNGRRPLPQ